MSFELRVNSPVLVNRNKGNHNVNYKNTLGLKGLEISLCLFCAPSKFLGILYTDFKMYIVF